MYLVCKLIQVDSAFLACDLAAKIAEHPPSALTAPFSRSTT